MLSPVRDVAPLRDIEPSIVWTRLQLYPGVRLRVIRTGNVIVLPSNIIVIVYIVYKHCAIIMYGASVL